MNGTGNKLDDYDHERRLTSKLQDYDDGLDVSTPTLISKQLCDQAALQLTKAASKVVVLYRRLTDVAAGCEQQMDMVKNLEMSIVRAQKMLHDLTSDRLNQTFTIKSPESNVGKYIE